MTQSPPAPRSNAADTPNWGVKEAARDLTGAVLGDYRVESLIGRGGWARFTWPGRSASIGTSR